ncbi:MAG: hypothetical protein GKR89_07050 [Candidatus Latescibacteria bacterium]|nr:hypothetical protein [Candidatus Latescibacterota bacterium]
MIIDFEFGFLKASTALADEHLDRLDKEAKVSEDPDSFGLFDQIEYITGFGFVACQTYLTATIGSTQYEKQQALRLGPMHRTGQPIVRLVNECANHWKHSGEWQDDEDNPRAARTLQIISTLGVETDQSYPIAQALHALLMPHPARFKHLLPFLAQWRDLLSAEQAV